VLRVTHSSWRRRGSTWPTAVLAPVVGPVAVQFGGHVDVDEVAVAQARVVRRDAVGNRVVDADAGPPGKVVRELRCRTCTVRAQYVAADLVELGGADAGPNLRQHRIARLRDDRTDTLQAFHVVGSFNRHAPHCSIRDVWNRGEYPVLRTMTRRFHLILLIALCACGHSGTGAETPASRQTSAAVVSINAFCDRLAAITNDPQRRRAFASLSANGEATPWREYDYDDLQARLQTLGTNQVAEFWQREDGAVFVQTTFTVDTGDWNQNVRYCFQADGSLARTQFTMNSFAGDEGMRGFRVRYFSAGGRQIFMTSETREIESDEKRSENEFQEQEPIYRTVSALPFAALMMPPEP
jgi:hypothetical protein